MFDLNSSESMCSGFEANVRGDTRPLMNRSIAHETIMEKRSGASKKKAMPNFMAQTACSSFKVQESRRGNFANSQIQRNQIRHETYASNATNSKTKKIDDKSRSIQMPQL